MATKLGIYNDALGHLAEPTLASLTESREPRRVLDQHYDKAVAFCLASGDWNFAMRTVMLNASSSLAPAFGFAYAYTKPDDWVRTYQRSAVPTFDPPLGALNDEGAYWYTDCDPLYARYVSNGSSYGGDLSLWPQAFDDYVAAHLAWRGWRIANNKELRDSLDKMQLRLGAIARARDALNEPPGRLPLGSWVSARAANPFTSRSGSR